MSKKLTEGEDNKESVLSKITSFFKKQKASEKKSDDEVDAKSDDDDDTTSKKSDDEDTSMSEKDDDDNDSDDQDNTDPDDDGDDATMEVCGTVINLNNHAETRSAIEYLMETNGTQNELLQAAAKELGKTKEQVKNDIKSTFMPGGSQRSAKSAKVKSEIPAFAKLDKDSFAARAAKQAFAKSKHS